MIPLIGAAIGGLASIFGSRSAARSQERIANQQMEQQRQLAEQARQDSLFRPVNVSTGLGQSNFITNDRGNVTGVNITGNPLLDGIQRSSLQGAWNIADNPMDTYSVGNRFFQDYLGTARPTQMGLFSQLQDRLQGQGLLGLTANGPQGSGNPFYEAFSRGIADSDAAAYRQAFTTADALATNEQARGTNALNNALGIDKQQLGLIDMGSVLGGRGSSAAAQGAAIGMPGLTAANSAVAGARSNGVDVSNAAIQNMIRNLAPRIGGMIGTQQPSGGFGTGQDYGNQDYGQYF